jgi:hypothetical protein
MDDTAAFGDDAAFCALGDETIACTEACGMTFWVAAHCACATGELFSPYEYTFEGATAYCTGDDACQSAVEAFYASLSEDMSTDLVAEYLKETCIAFTLSPTMSAMPTPMPQQPTALPVPEPSAVPIPHPTKEPTPEPTMRPSPLPTMAPVPDILVVYASDYSYLYVSEDGVVATSFTIALATAPLSDVTVTLASTNGFVALGARTVTFTYANFNKPVLVTVAGMQDSVDQGVFSPDVVTFSVWSADSLPSCNRENRDLSCGLAVPYNGFKVAPLAVQVGDDDEAGLVVTVVSSDATFDNFGDALAPAQFTLALNSEPTADVTIAIVDDASAYVTASTSAVTFTATNWATPQAVYVSATAATASRPACSDGSRSCAEVASYAKQISFVVGGESSDATYAGFAADPIEISAAVVTDTAAPPVVSTAVFGNLLASVLVTFDSATNRGGLAGRFACTLVLDLTEAEVSRLFGKGASCAFTSDAAMKITFGQQATVVPTDEVGLRALTVMASAANGAVVSLFSAGATFAVAGPAEPVIPSVSLRASSDSVGRCDGLGLDGSASSGSGGRAMTYALSLASDADPRLVANATKVLGASNAENGGKGSYKAYLPSESMHPGTAFTVTLTATNFLLESSSRSVTVTKLDVPAPIISVQGGSPRSATHSSSLTLAASAELPTMTCVSTDLSNARMTFIWASADGKYAGQLAGTSKNPRELAIPAKALAAETTYIFSVTGFMTDKPTVTNFATVSVVVGSQALVAKVGSSFRQVGRDASFTLSGGGSYDPDEVSGVAMTYAWACAGRSSGATCGALSLASVAGPTVPALSLALGTYAFTLTVAKGGRSATAVAVVEVTAGTPPTVGAAFTDTACAPAEGQEACKYNDNGYVAFTGAVAATSAFTTAWSAPDADVPALFAASGALVSVVAGRLSAVVNLGLLTPGNTYTLRLTATDSGEAASYAEVSLTVNQAPSSGVVAVTPSGGFTLKTEFTLEALDWVEEDYPLQGYTFGTVGVNPDGTVDSSTLFPFGALQTDASYVAKTLPAGSNATNFSVGVFASVVDYYGAVGSATATVRVRVAPLTVKQLANVSAALAESALEEGNGDAAKQVLVSTTEGMKTTTTTTAATDARRRLLAGSDAEALRAAVLANLWSTYAITPVTAADVASLLAVLVGVLDTPGEVTDATATSALSFLDTVLGASQAAGAGLSGAGASLVGEALASLFATSAFGASGGADSYAAAAAALGALRLASASQLAGALDGTGGALRAPGGGVDLVSYRGAAGDLAARGSLAVSSGGLSGDTVTAVAFDAGAQAAVLASGAGLTAASVLDLRVGTLASNVYEYALDGTSGSPAALASRLDQTGDAATGDILLRSKLTVVEVAAQDSAAPLALSGLASNLLVTLEATVPFATDLSAYSGTRACTVNDVSHDLGCPLTTNAHVCDWAANGGGSKYFFDFVCPHVVPTCLWWDAASSAFSGTGCSVVSGYAADAVGCSCSHLTTFALGAEATELDVTVKATPAPTKQPAPSPSAQPTLFPSGLPTAKPSHKPTLATSIPTSQTSTATTAVVSVSLTVSASAAPTAGDEAALKSAVATATGLAASQVKGFTVTWVQTSRRHTRRRNLLATFDWTVAFDLAADLATYGGGGTTTAAGFAAAVEADLSSSSFQSAVATAVPTATAVGLPATVANTRHPTMEPTAPTLHPVLAPTAMPVAVAAAVTATAAATTATTEGSAKKGSSSSPLVFIIVGALVGTLLLLAVGWKLKQGAGSKDPADFGDDTIGNAAAGTSYGRSGSGSTFEMTNNPSRGPRNKDLKAASLLNLDEESGGESRGMDLDGLIGQNVVGERKEAERAAKAAKVAAQAEKERDMARRKSEAATLDKAAKSLKKATSFMTFGMSDNVVGGGGGAELSPTEKERVRAVFAKIDADGNGTLDKAELVAGLRDLGHPNPTLETVEAMLAEVGFDGAEDLTLAGFEMVWASNQGDSAFFGASLEIGNLIPDFMPSFSSMGMGWGASEPAAETVPKKKGTML